jgi:hypothetical protein
MGNPSFESKVVERVGGARPPLFGALRTAGLFEAETEDEDEGVRVDDIEFILRLNSEAPEVSSDVIRWVPVCGTCAGTPDPAVSIDEFVMGEGSAKSIWSVKFAVDPVFDVDSAVSI